MTGVFGPRFRSKRRERKAAQQAIEQALTELGPLMDRGVAPARDLIADDSTVGSRLSALLAKSPTWVHRRVERFTLEPSGDGTHNISLDFTLPGALAVAQSAGRVLVPLGLMRKGPLARFSVLDPAGRPAPVLGMGDNSGFTVDMLKAIADGSASGSTSTQFDPEEFEELCHEIVESMGDRPDDGLKARVERAIKPLGLAHAPEDIAGDFTSLIMGFHKNFLLIVELGADVIDQRSVVKLSYTEPLPDLDLGDVHPEQKWDLPDLGAAASTHVEFTPPALLLVAKARLVEYKGSEEKTLQMRDGGQNTVHLVGKPEHRYSSRFFEVTLSPRRYGALTAMRYGAWVMTFILAGGIGIRWLQKAGTIVASDPIGTGPPAALLATGGLLLTWVARAPEDWTSSRILSRPRASLLVSALLAAASAGYLSIHFDPSLYGWRTLGWILLFVVALVNAALAEIFLAYCRSAEVASAQSKGGSDDANRGNQTGDRRPGDRQAGAGQAGED